MDRNRIGVQYERRMVPVAQITVSDSYLRRDLREDRVVELVESIATAGLINPIMMDQDGNLIAGAHRLEALKRLGWEQAPVCVTPVHSERDRLKAQLVCLDENLMRSELTELERGKAIAERKRLYLALHPETAPVQETGGPGRGHKTTDTMSAVSEVPTFAQDTAAQMGVSDRTIRRAVEIGEKIVPEASDAIRDTPLADNQKELLLLANLEPAAQVPVAEKIASGEARSVEEAEHLVMRAEGVGADSEPTPPDLLALHQGDFREVLAALPEASVDLILTAPPQTGDVGSTYADLGAHAARVLKPGGSLVVYVGQGRLREAMERLDAHLRYSWTLGVHNKSGAAILADGHVITELRLCLWYVRGPLREDADCMRDFIEAGRRSGDRNDGCERAEQVVLARTIIEKLTQPGDTVLDPFMGTGATLAAAAKLGRRGIGVGVDEDALAIAAARLIRCTAGMEQ